MIQLGNLAVICAKRTDVSLTISNGIATLTIGDDAEQRRFSAGWQDNAKIESLIHELNFGTLREGDTQD